MDKQFITLSPVPNFVPEIGYILASLNDIRAEWQDSVRDLTKVELATKILPEIQPIGAIIIHIAEAEYFWMQEIVAGNPMTDEIKELLHHDLWFKDFAAEDLDVEYCLQVVEKIHGMTRETLKNLTENDLEKFYLRKSEKGEKYFSLRFILNILIDHEGTHKGQIMLINRILKNKR